MVEPPDSMEERPRRGGVLTLRRGRKTLKAPGGRDSRIRAGSCCKVQPVLGFPFHRPRRGSPKRRMLGGRESPSSSEPLDVRSGQQAPSGQSIHGRGQTEQAQVWSQE